MGKVVVYPFSKERLEGDGVTVVEEFRDWVYDDGGDFFHGLDVAVPGDVIVFAWEGDEEWYLVGDAIVKINEESEEAKGMVLHAGLLQKALGSSLET